MDGPLLVLEGLSKRYGGHAALRGVWLHVAAGERLAVIGENGAGKSTLAKIVAGAVRPDEGQIRLAGSTLDLRSPRHSIAAGIAFIPQELSYVPALTVAENVVLGQWPSRAGFTRRRDAEARAKHEAERFGIELDVSRAMSSLTLADRQLVEILKALTRRARVIVLDEPTASLNAIESANLHRILGVLVRDGVGIIYISHRMDEVFRTSDRVAVLRNGELVGIAEPSKSSPRQLITWMLGQAPSELTAPGIGRREPGAVLKLADARRDAIPALRSVSVSLSRGEVLAIYGVRGSGADVIAEALGGVASDVTATLTIAGQEVSLPRSPHESQALGIAYVPAERKRNGLVLTLSIRENVSLPSIRRLGRRGLVDARAERELTVEVVRRLNVRSRSLDQPISQLSGGNQQKVLVGSRLATSPSVLVLHEPTRGVDVGARLELQEFLRTLAGSGMAILWVTSDVEEAVGVSDRLVVMSDGVVVAELQGEAKTQPNAVAAATRQTAVA